MEGVLAAFAQFDNDVRSDRTRAGMFFPEGIAHDGNRFNRTAVTAPLFNYLAPSERVDERVVSRVGIAPERRSRRLKPECLRIARRNHVERGETW